MQKKFVFQFRKKFKIKIKITKPHMKDITESGLTLEWLDMYFGDNTQFGHQLIK